MDNILASIALCLSIFSVLNILGIVRFDKPKTDKFEKFRDENGLLGRKKNG